MKAAPQCHLRARMPAPAGSIWSIIKNPMDVSWIPLTRGTVALENNTLRHVTIDMRQFGGSDDFVAVERCYGIDHTKHVIKYCFGSDNLPIKDHEAVISLEADTDDGGCVVDYRCHWTLVGDVSAEQESWMVRAVESIWQSGLDNIRLNLLGDLPAAAAG